MVTLYACGPEPMLKAVAKLAARYGRPSQLSTERIMGCNSAAANSCVVKVRDESGAAHFVRSCLGPVFDGNAWSGSERGSHVRIARSF